MIAASDTTLLPTRSSSAESSDHPETSFSLTQLVPVSLTRLLSQARHAKGVPPSTVQASGVATLNPWDVQQLNAVVLSYAVVTVLTQPSEDESLISESITRINLQSQTNPSVINSSSLHAPVRIWPLDAVERGFVALDEASLLTLNLTPEHLPLPLLSQPPTPPRRQRPKRRSSTTKPSPKPSPPLISSARNPARPQVRVHTVGPNIPVATLVKLTPKNAHQSTALPCDPDELSASLHVTLLGRAVTSSMYITITVLNVLIQLQVLSVISDRTCDPVAPLSVSLPSLPMLVDRHTKIDVIEPLKAVRQPNHKLGGLSPQRDLLKVALEAATIHTKYRDVAVSTDTMKGRYELPRGALIYGPSGAGKTALALSVAYSSGAHVELISAADVSGDGDGADSFSGLQKLDAIFRRAFRKAPSVVVLDDVDRFAPCRNGPLADSVSIKVTAALLTQLDRAHQTFIIGTTVHRDDVDSALRRAGRLEIEVELNVPDALARHEILNTLTERARERNKLQDSDVTIRQIAAITYGFVGADLASLWREAVARAILRDGGDATVTEADLHHALKRVGPSALREVAVEVPETRWSDIGGLENVKQQLREAVEWPMSTSGAKLFDKLGISPPKGVLLFGPPGCSKTLLARAVATECGANFVSVKGAELLSKWVGESEKAVRRMFARARAAEPCVIFFDEIDALASARGAGSSGGGSAQARVVAQLLHEMDGIDGNIERIVVIAATNRPDCLDRAFTRPGRIDAQVYVPLPDSCARRKILAVHTRKVPLAPDVCLDNLASDKVTNGFSGAEVAALVREAALVAMERDVENASCVSADDFSCARRKVSPRTPPNLVEYFERYVLALEERGG